MLHILDTSSGRQLLRAPIERPNKDLAQPSLPSGGGGGKKEETTPPPAEAEVFLLGKGTKPGGDSNKAVLPEASCRANRSAHVFGR